MTIPITNRESRTGYVLYPENSSTALGIVSEDYKRQAITEKIPPFIKESLILIEDKKFYLHSGLDYKGICRAIWANLRAGKIVQGGSTLTQQLARNLINNNKKTLSRKLLELVKALQLEFDYSKEEILTLYFNNIYWGNNLYGIRAACLYYYGKEPFQLTNAEQLVLLTLLRGPNYYINNAEVAKRRFHLLNNILLGTTVSKERHRKIAKHKVCFRNQSLQIFSNKCLPFITNTINEKTKTINSTIDYSLQSILKDWVDNSKYPVTAICIKKNKVVAVSSSFGNAHAFSLRANVGSTLKPFIYNFLRCNNIGKDQLLSTKNSNLIDWNIREANYVGPYISLKHALFVSNNNTFVNTCFDIGLSKLYAYLSLLFQKNISEFMPSSILGATKSGITLYELASYYYNFFCTGNQAPEIQECRQILKEVATDRFGSNFYNIFLKTGTTNENSERYAILGNHEMVLALVRGENPVNDYSKEGSFLESVKKLINPLFNRNASYKWTKR